MAEMIKCPSCGHDSPTGSSACEQCGAALTTGTRVRLKTEGPNPTVTRVVISDIDMDFSDLAGLLIKIGLAAIPAAIVLGIVGGLIVLVIGSLGR